MTRLHNAIIDGMIKRDYIQVKVLSNLPEDVHKKNKLLKVMLRIHIYLNNK